MREFCGVLNLFIIWTLVKTQDIKGDIEIMGSSILKLLRFGCNMELPTEDFLCTGKLQKFLDKMEHFGNHILNDLSDPRTKGWPLLGSPTPLIVICAAWLYFVLRAGPRYMRDRKPYQLKSIIQAYNVFQVVLNTYISYELMAGAWLNGYTLPCTHFDSSNSPHAMRIVHVLYIAYILKLVDFLDTIFYVLRRKDNQISFLHVYHHLGLPFLGYLTLKYAPGGQSVFTVSINTMVHVIMYTYYMLAAMGPQVQPYLWWKRYLTGIQLVQFLLQLAHVSYTCFENTCNYPADAIGIFFIPYVIGLFILFSNFYIQSYLIKKKEDNATHKKNDEYKTLDSSKYLSTKLPTVLNPCKQINFDE